MSTPHTIAPGDAIAALATAAGLSAEAVWTHADNAALRRQREVPQQLQPGDVVRIPQAEAKAVAAATGQRHMFRRHGVPAFYRARILAHDGTPRANEAFVADVDGVAQQGSTDGDGKLEIPLPCGAKQLTLTLDSDGRQISIALAHLQPPANATGTQMRLRNLGYVLGDEDGAPGMLTRLALIDFQVQHDLPVTGEDDAATRAALAQAHDFRS
ncbi:peptidoglycan-binding protein [Andreprevotia lacus]|nr:peptidoglycan-binding protein [Andreprevotia lacus]